MANGDYWELMGIYFHAINLSWGLIGINGDYWGLIINEAVPWIYKNFGLETEHLFYVALRLMEDQ